MNEALGAAIALSERREMLCKMRPRCPYCGSDQVQLLDRFSRWPAEWRCRKDRRHSFVADTLIAERAVNGDSHA